MVPAGLGSHGLGIPTTWSGAFTLGFHEGLNQLER